jgi:hypothetical protein
MQEAAARAAAEAEAARAAERVARGAEADSRIDAVLQWAKTSEPLSTLFEVK